MADMVDGGAKAAVRPHLRHLPSLRDPRIHILMSGSRLQQAAFRPEPVPLGDLAVAWQQDPALEGVVRRWWDWLPRPKCWMVQWAEWRWLNMFLCEELAPTLAGLESFAESAAALDYIRLAPASVMDYQDFAVGMLEIACNFSPSCEARGEAQWLDELLVRLQRRRKVAAAACANAVHEDQPARMAAGNEVFSEPKCGGNSPEGPRTVLPDLTADLAPPFERAQPARAQACPAVAPRIETCSSGISVRGEARPLRQAQAQNGHILFGFTAPKSAASNSLLAQALQKAPLESWSGRKLDNWREEPDEDTKAANSGISGRVLQPATALKRAVMTHRKGSNRDPSPPNCARSSFGSAEAPEFRGEAVGYRTSGISDDPDETATPGHGTELRMQLGMGMKWSQQRGNQFKLVLSRARPRTSTYRWPRQIESAFGSPWRTCQMTGNESRSPHGRRPSSADPLPDAELEGHSTVVGQSLVSSRPENTTPIVPRPQSATGSIRFSGVSEARRDRPSTSLGFNDHGSPLGYRPVSCWPAVPSRAPSASGRKARQTAKASTAVHASQSNSIRPVWQNSERGQTPAESFPTVPAARLHYLQNNNDAHDSHNGAETQVRSPESNFRSLIGTPSSMISVRVEHAGNLLNKMRGCREIEVRVPSRQDAFTRVSSQVVPVEGASLKAPKSADSHNKSAMIQREGLSVSTVTPARGDDVKGVQKQDSGERDGSGLENDTSQVLPIAAPDRNTLPVVAMEDLNPESLENLRGLFGRQHQESSLSSNSITTYDEMRLQLLDEGSLAQSLLGDVLLSRQLSISSKKIDAIPSASNFVVEAASPDSELSEQLRVSPHSSLYAQHQQKQDKGRQANHSSEDISGRIFNILPVAETEDGTETKWELVERPSPRQHGNISGEEGSLCSESDQYA